ncbi:sugar ABC transporter ATPase [Microbacterium sp. MC2]
MTNDNLPQPGEPDPGIQPLQGRDTTIEPDPNRDPAQAEWDRTTAADDGVDLDVETATGADPAEIPAAADDVPAADRHADAAQPETQGAEPIAAELGEDGEGDLAPEDL